MSKNLSQTPKTVAIVVEKITIVRAKKAKNQHGSQPSNTPYWADSPKRHVTVIVEEIKRTLSLIISKTVTTVTL